MRNFNPLILFAAIMFAGVLMGCKNDPVVDDQPQGGNEPIINIGETSINVAAEGGDYKTVVKLFGGQGTINVNSWSPDSKRFAFVSYRLEE